MRRRAAWVRGIPLVGLVILVALAAFVAAQGAWAPGSARAQALPAAHAAASAPSSAVGRAVPLPARRALASELARASGRPGNFDFKIATSSDGNIAVHYYSQSASYGTGVIAQAQRALRDQVQPRLGFSLAQRVDIYVYNSRADFLAGAQPDSPEITGAFSMFDPSTIYLPGYYDGADEFATLAHELTHITFHQHLDAGHLDSDFSIFPLWFEEGQAASVEPANSAETAYEDSLVQNIRYGGRYLDIFSQFIWDYPQDPDTDDLAYAESRAFINYLYATYGATRYHQFIADAESGNLLYAAQVNLGADLQSLQGQWVRSLGRSAAKHASGTLPLVGTATPFTAGTLPPLATRTQPYPSAAATSILTVALGQAGLALLVIVAGLVASAWWVRRQRAFARARALAPPLPSSYFSHPSFPSYQFGPHGEPLLVDRPLTYAETLAPTPALTPLKVPRDLRWPDRIALVLTVPLVLASGVAWALADHALSWRTAALAAGAVALLCAAAAGLLGQRARRQGVFHLAYFIACGVLAVTAVLAGVNDTYTASMAQGLAYERDGAYTLASRAFTEAGAAAGDRMRLEEEWGQAAYAVNDYRDAATHYRAAVALEPSTTSAQQDRGLLVKLTLEWDGKLLAAQRYAEAVGAVTSQLTSSSCDATCKTILQPVAGDAYLAWIQNLCAQRQPAQALAEITALSTALPDTAAGKSGAHALSAQKQGMAGAWAEGKAGDPVAMDLVAELIAARTSDPLQLALASETSQPVAGTLDHTQLYKTDVHLLFLAFPNAQAANQFAASLRAHSYADTSLFKVAAGTDASGGFTAWLPGGYTYLPIWEAPPEGSRDDYFTYTTTSLTVVPFTPLTLPQPISS